MTVWRLHWKLLGNGSEGVGPASMSRETAQQLADQHNGLEMTGTNNDAYYWVEPHLGTQEDQISPSSIQSIIDCLERIAKTLEKIEHP